MSDIDSGDPERINNRILLSLKPEVLERLRPHLKLIHLARGTLIDEIDGPVDDLYFINRGLVSIVKTMQDGRVVEVGAIGIEGVTDPTALFGSSRAILETMVQIPDSAFRIKRCVLISEMERDAGLRTIMQEYARFAIAQLARTSACNRLHSLDQRCCRWLLIAHDGAMEDTFGLTHEFLAMMLGVQRTGVSVAVGDLKRAGLIDYSRGRMTIADRTGLEARTCECYEEMQADLDNLFRPR